MKTITKMVGVALVALTFGTPTMADQTFTVTADTTIDGNAGKMMFIEEPGYGNQTVFVFDEGGLLRVYATRDGGSDIWNVLPGTQYVVPTTSITAGMTWRFIDDDGVVETRAEAIQQETVTTGAGTFPMAWRIDISRVSSPSQISETHWIVEDVGMIKSVTYFGQWITWESTVESYSVTGTGFFPLDVGNIWQWVDATVPAAETSMGSIKSRYGN